MARDTTISITKAIAIILMVIGHACYSMHIPNMIIAAFNMPLFFILSGMCFKESYLTAGGEFCKRKIVGIYWPYIKWSILFLLLHNVFFYLHIYDTEYGYRGIGSVVYSAHDYLYHLRCIITKMDGHEQLLGAYWFMRMLLIGNLLFYAVCRFCKQKHIFVIGILLLCSLLMRAFSISIPYLGSYMEPFSATFIAIGYAIKNAPKVYNNWYVYMICFIILLVSTFFVIRGGGMRGQSEFTIIPYIITAFAGSYLCILICEAIQKCITNESILRILSFIGDHTFEIMTLHFLAFKLVSLIIIAVHNLPINQLAEFPIIVGYVKSWWLAYLIAGISVPTMYAWAKEKIMTRISNHRK